MWECLLKVMWPLSCCARLWTKLQTCTNILWYYIFAFSQCCFVCSCEVGKSFFQDAVVSSYPDHRLAVAASAVPDLYVYVHQSLFELRSQRYRVEDMDTPPHTVKAFDKLSKVVLFFNSECATAWNIRSSFLISTGALCN